MRGRGTHAEGDCRVPAALPARARRVAAPPPAASAPRSAAAAPAPAASATPSPVSAAVGTGGTGQHPISAPLLLSTEAQSPFSHSFSGDTSPSNLQCSSLALVPEEPTASPKPVLDHAHKPLFCPMWAMHGPHSPVCWTRGLIRQEGLTLGDARACRLWETHISAPKPPAKMREGAGGTTACQEGNVSLLHSLRPEGNTEDPKSKGFSFLKHQMNRVGGTPLLSLGHPCLGLHPCLLSSVAFLPTAIQGILGQ